MAILAIGTWPALAATDIETMNVHRTSRLIDPSTCENIHRFAHRPGDPSCSFRAYKRATRLFHPKTLGALHGIARPNKAISGSWLAQYRSGIQVVVRYHVALFQKLRPRYTVLLVEDALTTRCILEQFFARAGCQVLQAPDVETAMRRLQSDFVDVVILDLRLADGRSGLEVLDQMQLDERLATIPAVILTGVTNVEPQEEEIIRQHNAHLLYKSLGYREVVNRLERILASAAA